MGSSGDERVADRFVADLLRGFFIDAIFTGLKKIK
jgi:hypothetical protein